jgi:hypothetical protein
MIKRGRNVVFGGGNRHTQIPAAKLYLNPESGAQGQGFWTGKYGPKDEVTRDTESPENAARITAFQERATKHQVVRYYEERPVDEEETIKSMPSVKLFEVAKGYFAAKRFGPYEVYKKAIENRAFMNLVHKAIGAMVGTDRAGSPAASAGRGKESMPANRDKRVFNAMHGVEDESTEETKKAVKVKKAILTKPSEKRERPQKKATAAPTAKVGASKNGKKTYDYRKPSGKKPAAASSPKGAVPDMAPDTMVEPSPHRLAAILDVTVDRLHKIADSRDERGFITFFKQHGSSFIAKHKVSDEYLASVFAVLKRQATKSLNPKKADLAKRGVTLAKTKTVPVSREHLREDITEAEEQVTKLKTGIKRDKAALSKKSFTLNPRALKKGTEEREFADSLHVSGVNTLAKLATFLTKGYDLSQSDAAKSAKEFHSLLKKQGAIS